MPRRLQISLRRTVVDLKRNKYQDIWPINQSSWLTPEGWPGWPHNKQFALVLTHDVDTKKGEERCLDLMNVEKDLGFKSAFYFVPSVSRNASLVFSTLRKNKFEIGVHGLFHDDKHFRNKRVFQRRSVLINYFIAKWEASGFRSPCMYHNLEWLHDLNILYDGSTFDVDPFEPQPDGVGTIFPFIIKDRITGKSYVELPYTLPQDFTIFILMKQKNIDIWARKLDWIAEKGGMALVIAHPDYMNFDKTKLAIDEYPSRYYIEFLSYIKKKYDNQYWNALPEEVVRYFKLR